MGKVAALPSVYGQQNHAAKKAKKSSILSQVYAELKRDTGLDYRKIVTNDFNENRRLQMKRYQANIAELTEE